jgi:predicted transposase YbfD/YdcC
MGLEFSSEARYYLLSFERDMNRFASSVRSHWGSENSVHWVLMLRFAKMTHAFALVMPLTRRSPPARRLPL